MRTFAETEGVKLGAVAQPLRAALTGRTTSPGIFEVLAVLGKTESLARLGDQAAAAKRRSDATQYGLERTSARRCRPVAIS